MPDLYTPDTEIYLLTGALAAIFLFLLLYKIMLFTKEISEEMRILNREIRRTAGDERKFYICERRRLILSFFPFVKY